MKRERERWAVVGLLLLLAFHAVRGGAEDGGDAKMCSLPVILCLLA